MRSVCSADVDEQWYLTLCLHFTAGSATSWVSCANEPSQAVLERASQDAFDVIRLMHSKAAVWTVDDVARLILILKRNYYIIIYLYGGLYFYALWHMILNADKIIRSNTKFYL